MLNAVTPLITPDPPWLANLPLVVAIMAFLLAFGLSHIRAERARAAKPENPKNRKRPHNWRQGAHELWLISLPVLKSLKADSPVQGNQPTRNCMEDMHSVS